MRFLKNLTTLLTFVFLQKLQNISMSSEHESYKLSTEISSFKNLMITVIKKKVSTFVLFRHELLNTQLREDHVNYLRQVSFEASAVADIYIGQWSCAQPTPFASAAARLLASHDTHVAVVSRFENWFKNRGMHIYLKSVQGVLCLVQGVIQDPLSPSAWQNMVFLHRFYTTYVVSDLPSLLDYSAPKIREFPFVSRTLCSGRGDGHRRSILVGNKCCIKYYFLEPAR